MQPDQQNPSPNSQNPEPSQDYLDTIAAKPKKSLSFLESPKQIMIAAGLGLAFILSIVLIIVNGSGEKPLDQMAARFNTVEAVHARGESEATNSQLRATNSTLGIYLVNTKRDLNSQLENRGLNTDKLSDELLAQEPLSETLDKLEDDRLNGVFDRAYAREMSYLLETLLTMFKQAKSDSDNQELIDVLDSAHDNLAPIQQEFAEFNETS